MIELIQFPWSPFCIVQRRILEFSGTRFKITNVPNGNRSLVWKVTREQYYQVPVLRDGKAKIVFESGPESQVIAKYLDGRLKLGLFPEELEGLQSILWRYIENDIEGPCFKLNDTWWREFVAADDRVAFLRHKERKFGAGCIQQWVKNRASLLAELTEKLAPFEQMLTHKPFLLGERPYFVDFDLYGMLGNFLYSGHYRLPAEHKQVRRWFIRMTDAQHSSFQREKELYPRHQRTPARPSVLTSI
jgi:glutathione S-transferase